MIRRWAVTAMGLGYSPFASGTAGSAGAIVVALLAWLALARGGADLRLLDSVWIVLTLLAGIGCVAWGPWAIREFAATARKKGDPGEVVIDELAGQWLSLVALPMPTFGRALAVLAAQFFLFRLFDVIKPPPGRQLEKLPAGWGILLDDLAAAVYANLVGQVVFRVLLA